MESARNFARIVQKIICNRNEVTWLQGPQKVDKCDENDEFGSAKSDENSTSLLTKYTRESSSLG